MIDKTPPTRALAWVRENAKSVPCAVARLCEDLAQCENLAHLCESVPFIFVLSVKFKR